MGMRDRPRLPPLELLPSFEAAARSLSFTKAAAELALTQSAVSRRIQALERALGTRLFERETRALRLTESGRLAYHTVREVLERIDELARTLGGVARVRAVTLTTTPGFASLWLIPRLVRFTQAHPGVDVRTSASNEVIDIERASVDLAIRYCPVSPPPAGEPLAGGDIMPVCSPRLLASSKPPLASPADLAEQTILYLDDPRAAWFDWDLWFHALGLRQLQPARRLHFSHYDQMIQAAVNGQGVALGVEPLVRDLIRAGRLVAPFKKAAPSARAFYLMRSRASRSRPEVDAFAAWLLAEVRAEQEQAPSRRPRTRRTK